MSNSKVLFFLRDYSTIPFEIDSLIVTSYIKINNIKVTHNNLIKDYIFSENDKKYSKLLEFIRLLQNEKQTFSLEDLILLFEFVISPSDKIVNGAVYTPKYIRNHIVNSCIGDNQNLDNLTACDIACGCGGFLYEYALALHIRTNKSYTDIIEENLFGIDITEYSIERTKILLSLLALRNGEDKKEIKFNLFVGDSLEFDWFENSSIINKKKGFNFVFSNPPYVGSSNLDQNTKSLMKNWSVASTGKLDLYIPFFEIGMKWLSENGTLGYITVNNFYRSLNGRALRSYFSKNEYKFKLIDFGSEQVFQSRLTYTCICQISKTNGSLSYTSSKPQNINLLSNTDFISFKYSSLNDFDGWQLDDAKTQLNVKRLENSGKKLGDLVAIRNGFATLRNKIYLFKPTDEDDQYFYFEKNSKQYKVEKRICRDAIKPNILKKESDLNTFNEKIIFPYSIVNEADNNLFEDQSNRLVRILAEDEFIQNFPYAFSYLVKHKDELAKRDKGEREYITWYAYGRSQALNILGLKLLFPYISDAPYFVFTDNEELLFYNGYALVSESKSDLKFLKKLLETDVFWYYITRTSKPYANNYFALAKNYVKNFSIPEFSKSEKKYFMKLKRKKAINKYLLEKYNITDLEF